MSGDTQSRDRAEDADTVHHEDISVRTRDGQPALEIGDATIILRTTFEGAPPETAEVDHYEGPFWVLDFDEEYFDGLLEIEPRYDGGGEE